MKGNIIVTNYELLECSLTTFRTATVTNEDWAYCRANYYAKSTRVKPEQLDMHMERMLMVNSGLTGAEVGRRKKVTTASVRCSVVRGMQLINQRRRNLPEYKLSHLLSDS